MLSAEEDLALHKKIVELLHELDAIRDKFVTLGDILRHSLQIIVRELGFTTAFIQYFDLYDKRTTVALDQTGIITHDFDDILTSLMDRAKTTDKTFVPDEKVVHGHYAVVPLRIGRKLIGILAGLSREPVTDSAKRLLEEAGSVLDTTIRQKCDERLLRDEKGIVAEIDDIIDEHIDSAQGCEDAILRKIAQACGCACAYIFKGTEREMFDLIATNDLGTIVWREYPDVVLELKQVVQECVASGEVESRAPSTDDRQLSIAGKAIKNIVGFPLTTKVGDSAGILVLTSYDKLSEGHRKLVKAACALLDTSIVRGKRTEMVVKRFKKYVGSDTIGMLLENPEWLNPRKEKVVIFSADLAGSTRYAASEPDALRTFNLVNKYLRLIAQVVIDDYKGTLDKFIGDEVMALFGAPVKDHNAPFAAIECAMEVRDRITRANEEARKRGEHSFDVKLTLGLADVIIGEVGSEDTQTDYTAIGDGVNQLFRLAAHSVPNEIMMNESLKELVDDVYEIELVDRYELKGIPEPQAAFRLVGKK